MGTDQKKKILLVDDEEIFANILKLVLDKTGRFNIRIEHSGTAAIRAAREFDPDLIFLDIIMPDMDGSQVAEEIRKTNPQKPVPIVFLTAVITKNEQTTTGGLIGGYPFIAKPVEAEEVMRCINQHLGPA